MLLVVSVLTCYEEQEISAHFNKKANWYFGTDGNVPEDKFDFLTVRALSNA